MQDEQNVREVLEGAWNALHDHQKAPWQKLAAGDGMDRFRRFLDAKAYLDAAMMLVGPDTWLEIKGPRKYLNIPTPVPGRWSAHIAQWNHEGDVMGWADHPAIALATAALKAKEQQP